MKITEIPTGDEKLVISTDFGYITPDELFNYWVVPVQLQKWWPTEAEVEPRTGGTYHLFWPQMAWHLRGHYTEFDPGRTLAFTWQWDHYPVATNVVVTFEALDPTGTRMTVTHGSYGNSEQDRIDREEHRDGWTHFITQLHDLLLASSKAV